MSPLPVTEIESIRFHNLSQSEAVRYLSSGMDARIGGRVITPNLHFYSEIGKNEKLLGLINSHDLILCDSMALFLIARIRRVPLRERVTGSDLINEVARLCHEKSLKVAFLGGTPEDCEAATTRFRQEFPNAKVIFYDSPQIDIDLSNPVLTVILEKYEIFKPDVVILAFGFPKQELLARMFSEYLPQTWFFNFGMGLSYFGGTRRRCPKFLQLLALEWFWRFCSEPRRLFRRYLIEDVRVLLRMIFRSFKEKPLP